MNGVGGEWKEDQVTEHSSSSLLGRFAVGNLCEPNDGSELVYWYRQITTTVPVAEAQIKTMKKKRWCLLRSMFPFVRSFKDWFCGRIVIVLRLKSPFSHDEVPERQVFYTPAPQLKLPEYEVKAWDGRVTAWQRYARQSCLGKECKILYTVIKIHYYVPNYTAM